MPVMDDPGIPGTVRRDAGVMNVPGGTRMRRKPKPGRLAGGRGQLRSRTR
jgi:hypothetical protein